VELDGVPFDTGLENLALLGDSTDIGCNSVLNPGVSLDAVRSFTRTRSWREFADEYDRKKQSGPGNRGATAERSLTFG
jgi:hypothetical protein